MIALLRDNPLLLLFVIAAVGWPLGRLSFGGVRLGVAAVLFTGLAIGALDPELKLPELVYQLGLVLFVYTVGLSSGSIFFSSLRNKGLRDNAFVIAVLIFAAVLIAALGTVLRFAPAQIAGLFAGGLTNTPALAGVLEFLKTNTPANLVDAVLAEPVVAYSIAYPVGVLGMILAVFTAQKLWKVNYAEEAKRAGALRGITATLENRTVLVDHGIENQTISQLIRQNKWEVVFGRIKRGEIVSLASNDSHLQSGDLVTVVGPPEELERITKFLGQMSIARLDLDQSELDYRRIFVSNPQVAGRKLRSLNLPHEFGALITRVRRGDIYLVPTGDTVLEMGDRARVLAKRDQLDAVTQFLGDSYRAVSEIDVLTLGLGLALGTLLGLAPIPLPGGLTLRLGIAGGPLIAALVLGALGRTGPFLWSLPYGTNLTLRQFGLVLFLAGVGSRAGYTFVSTLTAGNGVALFGAGMVLTLAVAMLTLWLGYKILKIPMSLLTGMLAGLQTQPALLSFAAEQSGDDLPNVGYATVYPVATITKILLAQIILALLLR